IDDVFDPLFHFFRWDTLNGGVEVDILATAALVIETRTETDQGGEASVHRDLSLCRFDDAGQQPQQRRFTCAVMPDDAECVALVEREADIFHRPEGLAFPCDLWCATDPALNDLQRFLSQAGAEVLEDIALRDMLDPHDRFSRDWNWIMDNVHRKSARRRSLFLKNM